MFAFWILTLVTLYFQLNKTELNLPMKNYTKARSTE